MNDLTGVELEVIADKELANRLDYLYETLTKDINDDKFDSFQKRRINENIRVKLESFMEKLDEEIFKDVK